jgi:Histidine kinase-, DNA gyrase B-, and HSP90-like ATPase
MTTFAKANPHKRLFISLITRDISLADAVLDLLDNAINSAIQRLNLELSKPADYISLLERKVKNSTTKISIDFDNSRFEMRDNADGISLEDATERVFMFGRPDDQTGDRGNDDTLSVYGIGMKRAIFKIGNNVQIASRHKKSGFNMDLDVRAWETLPQNTWQIEIEPEEYDKSQPTGTDILITQLFPDISKRISDGSFESELVTKIARTYSYFLERVVTVEVNGRSVSPSELSFGENTSSDHFEFSDVSCVVKAGIGVPDGKTYTAERAGWYVFCNGRAVAFAEKTAMTGWGTMLPTFQPKHRPFLGLVIFTSDDPETLPWTTTKSSINEESAVWQHTLRVMQKVGRQITSFLDKRYSEDGTEISAQELATVAGNKVSVFKMPAQTTTTFKAVRQKPTMTSIQIRVRISEVDEVRTYLGRRTMPNTEIGHHIFDYYLNEVVRD